MRSVALLSVIVLLAMTASAATDATTVEAPRLLPGDFWTYATNTTLAGGLSLRGTVTLTVTGLPTVTVEGTVSDVYNLSLSGTGTAAGRIGTRFVTANASGSWALTGWELMEVRGLKRLWVVLDLRANGTLDTRPVPLAFDLRVQNTTRYRLESDAWQFPLRVGDSTTVASRMNFTEDVGIYYGIPTTPTRTVGVAWWNITYTMDPAVHIDTPAGAFDAFPINETDPDGASTRLFFAPLAGNAVRTETRNETSELGSSDLVAYRYQALEPSRFLGLTLDQWAIAAVVMGGAAAVFVWWWRGRKKRGADQPVVPPP